MGIIKNPHTGNLELKVTFDEEGRKAWTDATERSSKGYGLAFIVREQLIITDTLSETSTSGIATIAPSHSSRQQLRKLKREIEREIRMGKSH